MQYLQVHLLFTLPALAVLAAAARPFLSSTELAKMALLAALAFVYTTPWDNAVIYLGAWSYEPGRVLARVGLVPVEEYFFFVAQTALTALATLLARWRLSIRVAAVSVCIAAAAAAAFFCVPGTRTFYLASIIVWAMPVLALQLAVAAPFIARRWQPTLASIALPTLFLWCVDHIAIRDGVWSIHPSPTTGIMVTPFLPLEEAVFFVVTNAMIVCGLMAVDRTLAIVRLRSRLGAVGTFERKPESEVALVAAAAPSPLDSWAHWSRWACALADNTIVAETSLDAAAVADLAHVMDIARRGSLSFSAALALLPQDVRQDIAIVYAYCRVTDDVADDASRPVEARRAALAAIRSFLGDVYAGVDVSQSPLISGILPGASPNLDLAAAMRSIARLVHAWDRAAPVVPLRCLVELIDGCEADLGALLLATEDDIVSYAEKVAGSVGEACTCLMLNSSGSGVSKDKELAAVVTNARDMGVALQLVNMARDVATDAQTLGRIYAPTAWLDEWTRIASTLLPPGTTKPPASAAGLADALISDTWGTQTGLVEHNTHAMRFLAGRFIELAYNSGRVASARAGIKLLPADCRPAIDAALRIYLGIADIVRGWPHSVYRQRAATRASFKVRVLAESLYARQ
nr:hypothetical protein HK105_007475 [Polyrhizophydium stewartii]